MDKMYIPNTASWIRYYENLDKNAQNPHLKFKTGKQIGGGSLIGSPRSFITPIGSTVKPSEEEKVTVQLVSPVQQTEEMARDMMKRENAKKGLKRKAFNSKSISVKRRRTSKTQKRYKKSKTYIGKRRYKSKKGEGNNRKYNTKLKKKNIKKKKTVKQIKDIFG